MTGERTTGRATEPGWAAPARAGWACDWGRPWVPERCSAGVVRGGVSIRRNGSMMCTDQDHGEAGGHVAVVAPGVAGAVLDDAVAGLQVDLDAVVELQP